MKQYIVTEQDIERLRAKFFPFEQNELDRWVETLNTLGTTKARTIIAPKVNPVKTEVRLKDAIILTDEDILNAMAYTLYKTDYESILRQNNLEWEDVCQDLMEAIKKPTKIEFSFLGEWVMSSTNIEIACERFNNFKPSKYITDKFLVEEVFDSYFKVGLLNDYDRENFKRVGKYSEIISFLEELQLPYEWEYKKFFRLGCSC